MKMPRLGASLLTFVLLFGSWGFSQTGTGSIAGTIQDESGAVVPGVSVTIRNIETGISIATVTDGTGRYHAPSLIPGHYELECSLTGFESAVRQGIQVTVSSSLEINMTLKVGQVTERTVVSAEAPIVETASSSVSDLVDDKTIRDLPLNGRSFDQLIALQSSSPTFRARGSSAANGVTAVYSVSGARTQSNLFLIDGTEMIGGGNQTTNPGGILGKNMGVDAVQEFTVLSSNYSAEYGKKGGGIINIATRSGANIFHGSAFDFLRNSILDARNFFDVTREPPPFKRNNFGGALGGPIRKDHTFFFGNYEGLRERLGLTRIAIVPDDLARQGFLPVGGQPQNVGISPAVKPFLVLFAPPNGRNFGDGTAEYHFAPSQPGTQDFVLARFDHRISDKDSIFARYNFTRAHQVAPQQNPYFPQDLANRSHIVTLEEKRAYSRTVNEIRLGFSRDAFFNGVVPQINLDPSLVFQSGAPLVGQITFSSSTVGGPLTPAGPSSAFSSFIPNQYDVSDQVYHYIGPHSLHFGVQVQRIQHNDFNNTGSTNVGTMQFDSLQNFLAGKAMLYRGVAPGGDSHKSWRQIFFSTFVQDDYKLRSNLTLNLGLRYEMMSVPVEASGNRISNYRYTVVNGFKVLGAQPTLGSPFYPSAHDTFAPRIGFAWDPFKNAKFSVRGGFGMFYDQIDSEFRSFASNNPPYVTVLSVNNPPFPLAFSGSGISQPLPTPDVIDFTAVPTRLQYSFGIQRQITSDSVLNASYVGSRSYHLTRQTDANTAIPQILPGNVRFYQTGSPRFQPLLAGSRFVTTDSSGAYNSLQLEYAQRLAHGLRYKISYTFAKSIDDASITMSQFAAGNSGSTEDPGNLKGDRGLSAFDVRNSFATNFTYDIPWSHSSAGVIGRIAGGWQLGGILTFQSGTPFTALTGFSRSRDQARTISDRPNLKAGASSSPVLGGPDRYFDPVAFELQPAGFYGNLGRDTVIGPGFANVDLTLAKTTSLNERMKLDFRTEVFNVSNHANFALPNANIFNSSGQVLGAVGRILSTVGTSRQLQFGLKLLF